MKTKLEINLGAIQNNYKYLKTQTNAEVAVAIKADAYGLGAKEVGPALSQTGCKTFFVANIDEAIDLRKSLTDIEIKIYSLLGPDIKSIQYYDEYKISPILNNLQQIELWENTYPDSSSIIHIDTGMNRYGISRSDFAGISKLPKSVEYLMSHMACDDDKDSPYVKYQFDEFVKYTSKHNVKRSLSASGAMFFGPEYHFDMVRPGAACYGIGAINNPNLQIPVSLTAPIIHINNIKEDSYVGYYCTHLSKAESKLATIPIGYADGFTRRLSNKGFVFIKGIKVPIVGIVSMDLTILDVTGIDCNIGDIVEIIGPNNCFDTIASYINASSYEILTSLKNGRYERFYKK